MTFRSHQKKASAAGMSRDLTGDMLVVPFCFHILIEDRYTGVRLCFFAGGVSAYSARTETWALWRNRVIFFLMTADVAPST